VPNSRKSKQDLRSKKRRKTRVNRAPHIALTERDKSAGRWFAKLVALQARLYGPGGCPWDREQTHESIRKYLIEETYEVLDAMESGDPRKFSGELGDLLLQVVFHSILAEKSGRFTISDVIESVHGKMIRRHPHVFGNVEAKNSADVLLNWEQIKAKERAAEALAVGHGSSSAAGKAPKKNASHNVESVLAGVPRTLPGLLEAYQLTRRAAHIGFDWEKLDDIFDKLEEEKRELQDEVQGQAAPPIPSARNDSGYAKGDPSSKNSSIPTMRLEEEVGDLLFVGVNIARFLGVDPEIALKKANNKFKKRFSWMEEAASLNGGRFADLKRERKEELWNESKRNV
jgi:tetrapyrrole methylase family protein/MazG family protein